MRLRLPLFLSLGHALVRTRVLFNSRGMRAIAAGACLLAVPFGPALAGDRVYRCADSDGKISFQSHECAPAASPQRSSIPSARPAARSDAATPAPREVRPDTAMDPDKQLALGADVIVVGAYDVQAVTRVDLAHTARPVFLVLTSYHGTRWLVVPSAGTRLKAIVVASGDERRMEVQAPPGVPVLVDKLPLTHEVDNIGFRQLMSKLNARYGIERVLKFRGAYSLPPVVSLTGPFPAKQILTVEGLKPVVPAVRFAFNLVSIDGRALPFTNTGPAGGKRYTGVVRGGTLSSLRAGPAVLGEDGREAYYLEGNGGTLQWAPDGFNGKTQKIEIPPKLPPLSWGSGLAWDTRKGILVLVSFGGEGFLYRYDTRRHQWLDSHSLQNRDIQSLSFNRKTGEFVAISDRAELLRFNELGEVEEIQPLDKLLPDLNSTYDKGNQRLQNLVVAADGPSVAVVNVSNGTVTHIWTYDQVARQAQLTYKIIE